MNNFRAYHLGNYYLSSIQQGIQAAHAEVRLFRKAFNIGANSSEIRDCIEWSAEPTAICLNGGNAGSLDEYVNLLKSGDVRWLWSCFYEDEQSLNGALTNVCVLLPEYAYDARSALLGTTYAYYEAGVAKTVRPSSLVEFFEIFNGNRDSIDCPHLRKAWHEYSESFGDKIDVFTSSEAILLDNIAACRLAS